MTLNLRFFAERGVLKRTLLAIEKDDKRDRQWAVARSSRGLQMEFRSQTNRATRNSKLGNAWRREQYPRPPELATNPAAIVYSKAPKQMQAFSEAKVIRSQKGFFLSVPTDDAPARGTDGKRISPSNWPEARFGRLRFVFRRGRPSLLVVERQPSIKKATGALSFRKPSKRAIRTGEKLATVIMFILVPQVRPPKFLDIPRSANKAGRRMVRLYIRGRPGSFEGAR